MLHDVEILSASMVDLSTGQTFELGDATSISIESECVDTYMGIPPRKVSRNQNTSVVVEGEFDKNVLLQTAAIQTPLLTIFCGRWYVGMIPRRRHKAKRIAKKWIKRYGMIPTYGNEKLSGIFQEDNTFYIQKIEIERLGEINESERIGQRNRSR